MDGINPERMAMIQNADPNERIDRDRDQRGGYNRRRSPPRRHRDRSPPRRHRSPRRDFRRRSRSPMRRERRRSRSPRGRSPRRSNRQWKRRVPKEVYTGWDKAPPGYEGMTAIEVARVNPNLLIPRMPTAVPVPLCFLPESTQEAVQTGQIVAPANPQMRQAKRIYVGNVPTNITESTLGEFFNRLVLELKQQKEPEGQFEPPVQAVQIHRDKGFAFIEFKTNEDASVAISFDGVELQGSTLRIRRPKDYQGVNDPLVEITSMSAASMVPEHPDKVFVGGLPSYLSEGQVRDLLTTFGELSSFHLIMDTTTQSKGYAFCLYEDTTRTDAACRGLHGMQLGDKRLIVQRASIGARADMPGGINPLLAAGISIQHSTTGLVSTDDAGPASSVLTLCNMIAIEDLTNDEEYEDICLDVKEECEAYGVVKSLQIPRPAPGLNVSGVGKIFIQFADTEGAAKAQKELAGRKFDGRTVVTQFYPEDAFEKNELM